jgi:hypothetical protein
MARRPFTAPPPAPPWRSFPDDDASDEERWGSGSTWHLFDAAAMQDDEIDPLPIPLHPTSPPDGERRRTA